MLWIIYKKEKFAPGCSGATWPELAAVYRFESGDAAMRRFGWSTDQLGRAETQEGLVYMIDGHRHWFTTAHALPNAVMMSATAGFKLVLHREGDGEDYVKTWEMPPGREEIMKEIGMGRRTD